MKRMMQFNLLWTGREYYSLENCLASISTRGANIRSTIIGLYESKIYQVDYHIDTNTDWETICVDINCRHDNLEQRITLEKDEKGNWKENGRDAPQFNGCIDIDIPLTPFTNTLPIRRLRLQPGASKEIKVIYCDMLSKQVYPVHQRYNCLSVNQYQYENVPNDFEATIEVDEAGFVVDYPTLFVRTAALKTNYNY